MNFELITSVTMVYNDFLKKADAIVVLEGDGFNRIKKTARLFKDGWAPRVVVSGGINNPGYGSFPSDKMKKKLIQAGIPGNKIMVEERSLNTRDQAVEILKLAKNKGWKTIILVASHYHQLRAYLTFLQEMKKSKTRIKIINAPETDIYWFNDNPWGRRIDLMKAELLRIEKYRKQGHVATFKDVIEYQKRKESK